MNNLFSRNLRNIIPLAICFALSASTSSLTVSASSIIGFDISSNKSLSTLPLSFHLIGTMLSGLPASLLMKKIGRKFGFIFGTIIGLIGAASSSLSIVYKNFPFFCFSVFCLGILSGFTQLYRFAAVDVTSESFRTKAISFVMLGGIFAGFIGPAVASSAKNFLNNSPFAGSYIYMILIHLLVIFILLKVNLPKPSIEEKTGKRRKLSKIFFQPKFLVAILSSMISYGVMALVMTATPLAMTEYCGYPFSDAAFVIQWHVVGMFAPSFFTGSLIKRFGPIKIIITGIILNFLCILTNFAGNNVFNFWWSLILLGVGWNFMFVSGTSMVTDTYSPSEKAIVQGVNDFLVFGSAAFTSLIAGLIQTSIGWEAINYSAIFFLFILILVHIWYYLKISNSKKAKALVT